MEREESVLSSIQPEVSIVEGSILEESIAELPIEEVLNEGDGILVDQTILDTAEPILETAVEVEEEIVPVYTEDIRDPMMKFRS